jgi:hypothetical protein
VKSLGFIPFALIAPHHFVKLDNKYARVLDVTVPVSSGFPSVRRYSAEAIEAVWK